MTADRFEGLEKEIRRQLSLKSEVTCVGPPYVVLNGGELLTLLAERKRLREALADLVEDVDLARAGKIHLKLVRTLAAVDALSESKKWAEKAARELIETKLSDDDVIVDWNKEYQRIAQALLTADAQGYRRGVENSLEQLGKGFMCGACVDAHVRIQALLKSDAKEGGDD